MKKGYFFPLVIAFLLCASFLHAEEGREYPPRGMEILRVGDTKILVPKGTKMRKEGDVNIVEDISEYSSRKFVDIEDLFERMEAKHNRFAEKMEETFKRMEAKQERLEVEIEELKKTLEHLDIETDKVEVDMEMKKKKEGT